MYCNDGAESRGFIALIFLLFRDSFEGNTAIFLAVGGAAGLSEVHDPITPVGFRPVPSVNLEGHNHLSDVRHPPTRVPDKT